MPLSTLFEANWDNEVNDGFAHWSARIQGRLTCCQEHQSFGHADASSIRMAKWLVLLNICSYFWMKRCSWGLEIHKAGFNSSLQQSNCWLFQGSVKRFSFCIHSLFICLYHFWQSDFLCCHFKYHSLGKFSRRQIDDNFLILTEETVTCILLWNNLHKISNSIFCRK